jgi:IS30 family transposase
MGRRGRKRWLSVEDEYRKLILGGVAPLRILETDRHTLYLSRLERKRLAAFRREGLSTREISRRLGRSPSTINRELRRNMRRHDRGKYNVVLPHACPRERAKRERGELIGKDTVLRDFVQEKLTLEWSPEHISFWLRETHQQKTSWHGCDLRFARHASSHRPL